MTRRLSSDPKDRMGVYKSLEDVPAHRRLEGYQDRYEGKNTWNEFLDEHLFPTHPNASEKWRNGARRAGRRWKTHTGDRHHALARPEHIESFMAVLLGRMEIGTAYLYHWAHLERFYRWLAWSTDHPHTYNPVLMAAADFPVSERIWNHKLERGNRRKRE